MAVKVGAELKICVYGVPVEEGEVIAIRGNEVHIESEALVLAEGRVADCDCNLLACECVRARPHAKDCRYRRALTCAIAIECKHGYDCCPECDPCTCGAGS